jgi:cardiolipin synthase
MEPPQAGTSPASGRVLTAANLISFARLLGVRCFSSLLFGGATGAAVAVLAVGGTTDWVDGWVARRFGQVSRVGELLDPLVDRLYIAATVVAFTVEGVVPLAFTVALFARELVLLVCLGVLRRYGFGPPPVHYLGKTATFVLLAAFPVLLLAHASEAAEPLAHPLGWGLAWWGIGLYWLAAVLYVAQVAGLVRTPVGRMTASGQGRRPPPGQATARASAGRGTTRRGAAPRGVQPAHRPVPRLARTAATRPPRSGARSPAVRSRRGAAGPGSAPARSRWRSSGSCSPSPTSTSSPAPAANQTRRTWPRRSPDRAPSRQAGPRRRRPCATRSRRPARTPWPRTRNCCGC